MYELKTKFHEFNVLIILIFILLQVVGSKDIILYDPKWSEYLYPFEDKFLMNTAQVDPINPDLSKFTNFSKAKATLCTLNEGMYFKLYKMSNIGANSIKNLLA